MQKKRDRKFAHYFSRYVAFPQIIFVVVVPLYYFLYLYPSDKVIFGLGREHAGFIVSSTLMAVSLLFWEKIAPLEKFQISSKQLYYDVINQLMTGIAYSIYIFIMIALSIWLNKSGKIFSLRHLPTFFQFIIGISLQEFFLYLWHRLLHESGSQTLWLLHEPHHLPRRYHFLSGGRVHLLDLSFLFLLMGSLQIIFNISLDVMMWMMMYPIITGAVHHTNVDFRLGLFNWIFLGPELHRCHHDRDPRVAVNYSSCFPLWDIVFNTLGPLRAGHETQYGVAYHSDEEDTYMDAFIAPFIKTRRISSD